MQYLFLPIFVVPIVLSLGVSYVLREICTTSFHDKED